MAKELPYFRFTVQEWQNGDITLQSDSAQGVFVNICCYYWSQNCYVTLEMIQKRFKTKMKTVQNLIKSEVIKCQSGVISISFLDQQLNDLKQSKTFFSEMGKLGQKAKKKKAPLKPPLNDEVSYKDKDKDKEKDKDNLKGNFPHLLSEDFKKEFNEYLDSRKKKATPRAKELLLKKLHKFDLNTSIAMIQQSLENGWVGIFELQSKSSDHKSFRQIDEEKEIEYLKQVENEVNHVKRSGRLGYRPPKSIQGGNNKDISRLQQTDPEVNN